MNSTGLTARFWRSREAAIFCALGTLAFCWVAIWNGYPLVFSDTGTYIRSAIQHHNPGDRPIYYSLFIELFHLQISLWPVIVAQSLIASWIIYRALQILAPQLSQAMRVGVLIFLSICTSLPWTTGEIMPDFFAPLLVLAIYLLVVKSENLRRWDRLLLLAFLIAAQASHFSHIALAIGTSGVIAALSLLMRLRICWRTFLLNVAATCVAIAAILAINFAERKEVVLTPWSGILLLGKEMEYGTAQDYLAKACPTRAYRICPYRDALPHDVPTFLYGDHSVLNDLGGGEAYRDEAGRLAMDIFKDAPLRHALLALKATSAMFLYFPTGWGNDPEPDNAVTQAIHRYFGRERSSYDTSRQQTGRLHQPFFNAFQIPVGFLLLAGNVLLLAISIVRRDREMILLLSVILAAMLGNAFLCGGLSSSDGRYQSRMIPLLVLGIVPFLFNAKLRERPLP